MKYFIQKTHYISTGEVNHLKKLYSSLKEITSKSARLSNEGKEQYDHALTSLKNEQKELLAEKDACWIEYTMETV